MSERDTALNSESRILVFGDREYPHRDRVFRALDMLANANTNILIITGACCVHGKPTELRGADRWGQEWAQEREWPYVGIPARWRATGRAAGPIRNETMLLRWLPTSAVGFPLGGPGSQNMLGLLRKAGLVVWLPDQEPVMRRPPLGQRRYMSL